MRARLSTTSLQARRTTGSFETRSTEPALITFRPWYLPRWIIFRDERRAMQTFMQDLARGAFTYAPATIDGLSRAMEIDRRYADRGLGLVDGSIVALGEDLGIRRLATRDVRHFAAVRLRDGSAFHLVAQPTDPDRS